RYQPLQSAREIRLLQLLSTEDKTSPVQCRWHTVTLQAREHQYEALSYCWGSSHETQKVYTDTGFVRVNKNLHTALRDLRNTGSERFLWADAICINQADIQERNHQVSLMKSIYSSAARVIVWLGEA
ncbi:heterokaryon incompatibility protein-domain-containing protein, partial [Massariosphaeria phaeospora]